MMIVNPARCEDRMVFRTQALSRAIGALGTERFGRACLEVFEQSFDVDHWALFRYRVGDKVKCLATASRDYEAAAGRNVDLFLSRCYRVDPSLQAFRQQSSARRPCLVKMGIGDVRDLEYRQCFETTNVRERLSFFEVEGAELLQLCVYRAVTPRTFSDGDMRVFASTASLIINAAIKHEVLRKREAGAPRPLDVDTLERRLAALCDALSRREREVCARAILGRTIDATATELRVGKTSVITYRQRAYQKLGVSRLSELVPLVCEASWPMEEMVAPGRSPRSLVQ